MEWLREVLDAFSQWMVEAPIAVQMLILTVAVVPAFVAVAWVLMFCIDRVARIKHHVDAE
ncbi:hypothetical protein HMPREF3227_01438 [Corynebacterium sp. CMW7794]|uniref:hypothetical protein n=1 Tax=Corynebacterium sp. CMW7794 TaxID=1603887 RepID=UPI00079A4565|nr:hypothetical protein [Corynebacterium sp. CMW7794]KXI17550.1 hypothetical protein HMPREF3227_01438 [Corynebacterium sp. CMW7794]